MLKFIILIVFVYAYVGTGHAMHNMSESHNATMNDGHEMGNNMSEMHNTNATTNRHNNTDVTDHGNMNDTMPDDHGSSHAMHNMSDAHDTATGDGHEMGHNTDHGHMDHNMPDEGMDEGTMDHDHDMTGGDMMDHNHNTSGGHMDGGMMDHDMHGGGMMMMMYFNFDLPVTVLFFGWQVKTQGQLAGACVAVLIFSVLHEGLKRLREHLLFVSINRKKKYVMESKSNGSSDSEEETESCLRNMFNWWHLLFSFMQIVQTTLGMLLMLIYMTFNVWLAFSVSIGSGLGYFLFSCNKRSVSQFDEDHCL